MQTIVNVIVLTGVVGFAVYIIFAWAFGK